MTCFNPTFIGLIYILEILEQCFDIYVSPNTVSEFCGEAKCQSGFGGN